MTAPIALDRAAVAPADGAEAVARRTRWGFPELFVISQTALPAMLYLPGSQSVRLSLRVSAFAISLAAFGWWQLRTDTLPPHRANGWMAGVLALLAVMLFNPSTASLQGGFAHAMLYLAVMSPLFWAPVLVKTPEHLARLLGLVLLCSGANSIVGVLQVYDPAHWMPAELSRIVTEGSLGLGPVTYVGPNGQLIVRPPGLFDTPGAVAGPGMFAALLGAIFGLSALPWWQRAGAFLLAGAGVAAIYLSHVRVSLIVLVLMFAVYGLVLLAQRRAAKATTFGVLAGGILVLSFIAAVTLGGQSVTERFMSLFAEDPLAVYYRARGAQLNHTISEMLFEFPLGAGLGRWGMTAGYFGTSRAPALWAEIQLTGWTIDGGVLMIVLYGGAIIATAISQFRLACATHYPRVAACGGVVFAANLGIAAMVISFTPFATQIGIQYWFLAGALHGVACHHRLHDA